MTITAMSNRPVAWIHLDAIQHNFDLARRCAPTSKRVAMVKANAYGHGIALLAAHLQDVDAWGVARVCEAEELRGLQATQPIVVFHGFNDAAELDRCRQLDLLPVVHSEYQLELLREQGQQDLPIWLKLDSGMHRLGFTPARFTAILAASEFAVTCILSHLANADQPDHPHNATQLARLDAVLAQHDLVCSMANSGAILSLPASHHDWVRPGIMLYGCPPGKAPVAELQTTMTLTAPVLTIKDIPPGEAIGYGGIWQSRTRARIAVVGIGYADGYPRELPAGVPVYIKGRTWPIVGRVSMDTLMVDVTSPDDGIEVDAGDTVELWGEHLPIQQVAEQIGTIGYTLMSRLTGRVTRKAAVS